MPIPPLTSEGLLPPGIHLATLEEVRQRFGTATAIRRSIAESLGWAIDALKRAGAMRMLIDGSFVDNKPDPNDVDCVVLLEPDYPRDAAAAKKLDDGIPFVQIIFFERAQEMEEFVRLQFMTDRKGRARGVIEVRL